MAMRELSWIDQRSLTRRPMVCFCRGSAFAFFFWLRRSGMMADHRHHGDARINH